MTELGLHIVKLGSWLAHLFLNLLHHVIGVGLRFYSEFLVCAISSETVDLLSVECQIRALLKLLITVSDFADVGVHLRVCI